MKGLLLAGGHGTRLRPLTYTGNKHMLPIANKPMLLYGLEHLRNAGIEEVGVVLGPIREGVTETLGDGSHFGLKITYISQPEPKGLAHAVLLSEEYMKGEPFVMYLGDNLLRQGVQDFVRVFEQLKADCVVGVCPVTDVSRYGIVELENRRVKRLIEKPKSSTSNLALVGVYVFGSSIFDAVKAIKPSGRDELEITDAIQVLVSEGKRVEIEYVKGWWKDTGKPEDLLEANQLVLADIQSDVQGELSVETSLTGNLSMGMGSKTVGPVKIRGPAIIGTNCLIGPDVFIGPYTSIGDGCILRNVEIENSIIMKECQIESGRRIVDSLIGSNSTIADGEKRVPRGYRLVLGERSFVQV
ncbi:MAG: glucose-1-phosphate thymidylyltransferase [Nitrososphaerales archaeon]|jgi:glucose-1-phosphate thymidylyltransferase